MIMPESTKIKQRSGMIRRFWGRRTSPIIRFQAQVVSRKTEVKMEWSLHTSSNYTLWSTDTET